MNNIENPNSNVHTENNTKPNAGQSLWSKQLFTAARLTESRLKVIQAKKLSGEQVDCETEFISLINLFNRLHL